MRLLHDLIISLSPKLLLEYEAVNSLNFESETRSLPIESLAAGYYTDLPYHNFKHAFKAANTGLEIANSCLKEGLSINPQAVYYALLFHDAGYHENSRQKGFATKEEYSAFLAGKALEESEVENSSITEVKKAIISTNRDNTFITNEEKAVRAADLAELAADYDQFMDNNRQLRQEAELLGNKKISWEEWKELSKETIEFYLNQDIHLTSAYLDFDGKSIWHKKVRVNLNELLKSSEI